MVRLVSTLSIAAITALLLLGVYFIKRKGLKLSRFTKPAALTLAFIMFIRYTYLEVAVHEVRGLNMYSPFGDDIPSTVLSILLIWFVYAAMLTVVLGEFFNYKTLTNINLLFAVPVFFLTIVFIDTYGVGVLGDESYTFSDVAYALGETGYSLGNVRLWFMIIETALGIALPVSHLIAGERVELPKGRGIASYVGTLLCVLIPIMPAYVPQALLGYADISLEYVDFSEEHRYILYLSLILAYAIFHALKDKTEDVRRFAMIYLSLATMWAFTGMYNFEDLLDPLSWPLHLCNTAMYLIPLCLIFKMNRLFNFTLFINVLGAFLAMVMPNIDDNIMEDGVVYFWLNHIVAFLLPILLVALKLFVRPKFKHWVQSLTALTVYFVLMLIVNAWFTNYGECDYFYLNSDFIVSKLGRWAEDTRNFVWSFNVGDLTFTFYPLDQAIFYVVYVGFTVGMWFLYSLFFTTWDAAEDRRQRERDYKRMKKELNEYLGGKSIHEPPSGDDSPRLTLSHFSKRYGSNKHYSVNNVSFDVHGGEVFGFLGPNGAGKSTIIKSIVGIQPITSGSIEICGYDVDKQPVQAKLHTGFVPDHYALYENLTGREYINYIADLYEVNFEYRNKVIEKLVKRFELTGSFDNQMKTYSHGMKQKITIMAALVHNPALWILDEPLTGLDPTSIHEVKECMKEHAAAGNIVFFSSHIIDVVEKICDRIAIIKKGQLRACVSIKELEQKGIDLEQFYLDIINNCDDEHVPYIEPTEEASLA